MSIPFSIPTPSTVFSNSSGSIRDKTDIFDTSNGTKYNDYPLKSRKSSSGRIHVESNNEDVISGLEALQSRLQQLKRNAQTQNKQENDSGKPISSTGYVTDILGNHDLAIVDSECRALQNNLSEILKVIRTDERLDLAPKHDHDESNSKPMAVTVTKFESLKPETPSKFDEIREVKVEAEPFETKNSFKRSKVQENQNLVLKNEPHYRLKRKQLPFILSKMPGKSFSLPVNVQLLLQSLKSHNPWMCSFASECATLWELIEKVETDLKEVVTALHDSIRYLTMESYEICKQKWLPQEIKEQRICRITDDRNKLIANTLKVRELCKQLTDFKKHLNFPPASTTTVKKGRLNSNPVRWKKKPGTFVNAHPQRYKITVRKLRNRENSRPPWNDQVTIPKEPVPRPSVSDIKYNELLQIALKRNGLILKKNGS